MAEEKQVDLKDSPQVKAETAAQPEQGIAGNKTPDGNEPDEFVEKEVIDHIEKQYGDPAKAVKKVKVKKEKAAVETPITEPEKKDEPAKVDEPKPAAKAEKTPAKEKKIEAEFFDPMDTPVAQVDQKAINESAAKSKVEEKAPNKTPEQIADEQNLTEYKKQAEAYQKIVATPQGKFLAELAEKGEDLLAAVAEIGLTKDYKTADEAVVIKDYFEKKDGLTGEALQAAIDEHQELPAALQRKFVREARTELDYDQQRKIGQYRSTIDNNKQQGEENFRRFESAIDSEVEESYIKRAAYGIKLTPDQKAELSKDSRNIFKRLFKEDGSINEKAAVFYTFAEKHLRTVRKNDYLKGLTEGEEKILETVHQPDRMESTVSAPVKMEKMSDVDRINRQYGNGQTSTKN